MNCLNCGTATISPYPRNTRNICRWGVCSKNASTGISYREARMKTTPRVTKDSLAPRRGSSHSKNMSALQQKCAQLSKEIAELKACIIPARKTKLIKIRKNIYSLAHKLISIEHAVLSIKSMMQSTRRIISRIKGNRWSDDIQLFDNSQATSKMEGSNPHSRSP